MFFLWGILIASPWVATVLLGIMWFTHQLLTPLLAGDNSGLRWNRPSFFLLVVTTIVSGTVAGLSLTGFAHDGAEANAAILFIAMNVSAAFLTAAFAIVVIELFRRRGVSALTTVIAPSVLVFIAVLFGFVVMV